MEARRGRLPHSGRSAAAAESSWILLPGNPGRTIHDPPRTRHSARNVPSGEPAGPAWPQLGRIADIMLVPLAEPLLDPGVSVPSVARLTARPRCAEMSGLL